jgi:cyclic beta-1,2-glucan synthetase
MKFAPLFETKIQAPSGGRQDNYCILASYFLKIEEANKALWELEKKGFTRTAVLHRESDGTVRVKDTFVQLRILLVVLFFLLYAALAAEARFFLAYLAILPASSYPFWIPLLAGGILGAVVGLIFYRRSQYGIDRRVLAGHALWLLNEESVLILQAPLHSFQNPQTIIRESGGVEPAMFLLYPYQAEKLAEEPEASALLPQAQLQQYARRLAQDHRLLAKPIRSDKLLRRVIRGAGTIHQICLELSDANRLEQPTTASAEWILDNEYIIESNANDIRTNLPRKYFRQLPILDGEPYPNLPRIYGLAKELVTHVDLRLDPENLLSFLEGYQSVQPLTIGELWALPQILRIALIEAIQTLAEKTLAEFRERESAGFWANRLISANRRDPGQLFSTLARLTENLPNPSEYFCSQLIGYLYDESNALALVQNWLGRTFSRPLSDLTLREQNRQTKDQISVGNAFSSLRQLARMDWRRIFEQTSRVEQILRLDPAGIYPQMDFATRDKYRRTVEDMARQSGMTELAVAKQAIDLSARTPESGAPEDDRLAHVGYYLTAGGRQELSSRLGCRKTLRCLAREWADSRHSTVFFAGFFLVFAAFGLPVLLLCLRETAAGLRIILPLLFALPVSQITVETLNYIFTRVLPPRTLPKMDFESAGVPDAFRTLVVVPIMLTDAETVRSEAEKLEIRFLGNKESNLLFSLFSDFEDSPTPSQPDDPALLRQTVEAIRALNVRYGGERFFLFHRPREWSESEQCYIGRERKRGKLEELHQFLEGARPESDPPLLQAGDPDRLSAIRFLITLDSDTQLPPGTARRMIETLAHPLNQPRFDPQGNILAGSYTILQPRVSSSLPSALASPFSRLFADAAGIDPYTKAVSDVYMDLTGEGSYNGKGIYDLRAFHRILDGRFPEERLLSHDLIEGEHVRTGLVSDIELFDDFPRTYYGYTRRQHRWIRGDWQILDWLFPVVPLARGRWGPNPLSAISRWKIFDNLRRSLLPIAGLILLAVSWAASPALGWAAAAVVGLTYFFHPLTEVLTAVTSREGLKKFSAGKLAHDILRGIAEAALMPHQAELASDAIGKAGYRRFVSHRGLLRWTSAQAVRRRAPDSMGTLILALTPYAAASALLGWILLRWHGASLAPAFPWLFLWFISPLAAWGLNVRYRPKPRQFVLTAADRVFLRTVARRTWRFFSDCVGEPTSWLPPDNFQISHQNRMAMRTSPTNIGLGMISTLAARDFGYLTGDRVIETLSRTMQTILKLERYEGHLLNWYDIQTLIPLEPRYVSTVDSGNLLASLYSLETGLGGLLQKPVLDSSVFDGLTDAVAVLRQTYKQEPHSGKLGPALQRLARSLDNPPERAIDALKLLRQIGKDFESLAENLRRETGADSDTSAWTQQLENQVKDWITLCDRYLQWMEILSGGIDSLAGSLPEAALSSLRPVLNQAPSLTEIAEGRAAFLEALQALREKPSMSDPPVQEWLDRMSQAFSTSKWLAGETLGAGRQLLHDVRAVYERVNMRFLYDPERRLFSIGYNVTEGRLDPSFYDLLASESRLGSYIAIARGEVSVEHWFSLGRLFREVDGHPILISWTGTMFEYLMPLLFQRVYENSLLQRMTREAVDVQIDFGRRHKIPWGLSESAFGDLDINKTYQYKAFGVPALGLKRQPEEELVVAPYASLLAVDLAPKESVRNLRRLANLGLLGELGYFDAIDFSRRLNPKGRRGINIRTYMSHHQSMGFLSLANFLLGNPVQRNFYSTPIMRAAELLLHERVPVPPPTYIASTRERASLLSPAAETVPAESRFDTPNTPRPRTQLLGHERYSVMITNAGGGYSRWGKFDLTRWRADRTQDSWGTFCYLRDLSTGKIWSSTHQPIGGKVADDFSAHFALDRAVFRRKDGGVDTETEVFVSAEDDVEIRRITLINRSVFARTLELTSYLELALAPHTADGQHPAFQKLFIRTEAHPALRTLVAERRTRTPDEPPVFIAHRWTLPHSAGGELAFETDRRRFIGRGRTLANPMGVTQPPGNSQGDVLDPILSIRESVVLEPAQRLSVSLVIAAGDTREKVLALAGKYSDPRAIDRAMEFTWAAAQLEMRSLRIQPDDARHFQQLASHLLYVNPLLRPSSEQLEDNTKGQAGLWPYGISGDLPIATATVGDARDLGLIRQMLQAHSYWRKHGYWVDLVILNEEIGGYERPLKEELERLIRGYALYTGIDQPGGIFLRTADQIPKDDLRLLKAASSVVIVSARGALPQQLSVHMDIPELPEPIVKKRAVREPSALLPFMELPYFNSLGGFTPDGKEYAVYLGPDENTPAPWINVLANPNFGATVSETGSGCTWYGNSQRNRLTGWSNDPVLDPPSEVVYLRDEETGKFWTPTASPVREETAYRARHGSGYTVFEHNSNGIEQELTVLVPLDERGGDPVKLQRLRLKNGTARRRTLSVNYYVEWTLGEQRESSQMHIATRFDEESGSIVARNRYHPEFGDRVAFAAIDPPPESYSGDRLSFLGRNRTLANPAAMERIRRSQRTGVRLDPCAALQVDLELDPGETAEVTCLLGQTATIEEARELIQRFRVEGAFESALAETRARWDELLGGIEIHTPELSADFLVNRWLLYQNLSCRIWGRTASYQSSGAYGFRDQLQDCLAHLPTHPDIAREHILRAAGRQFAAGDVQHWWHPPAGSGVRTRISDDPLWLAFATAAYVRTTGDAAILLSEIPFLAAPELGKTQLENYSLPEPSLEHGTLFEHCRRAVQHALPRGPHGLPKIGTGDWDDGLNRVGAGGQGESVWLGWFLAEVLQGMVELAGKMSRPELGQAYQQERAALLRSIEESAWDGEWYLRAFFDDGTRLGTAQGTEARIFSLPQSWARLCHGADPERADKALESAWSRLIREKDRLTLLFEPPLENFQPFAGYTQAYPPGVRENGGQYTHAAVWLAMALARRGDGDRAAEILRMLNPVERARDPDSVWRYGLEPYVTAADVYSADGHVGRGGWSWYTGSAGWMYRAWVEEILGLKIQGELMRIDPTIPKAWDGFQIRYRHGEAVYEIRVENPDHCQHGVLQTELDGRPLADGVVTLDRELVLHRIVVKMGNL